MGRFSKIKSVIWIAAAGFVLSLIAQAISYIYYVYSKNNYENPPSFSIFMFWSFGFPLPIFQGNTYRSIDQLNFVTLIINILITIFFCFVISLIYKFIWSKISARKLK